MDQVDGRERGMIIQFFDLQNSLGLSRRISRNSNENDDDSTLKNL